MKAINRNIAIAAAILISAYLMYTFRSIVAYMLVAWVLSMIGQPLMRFFKKIKIAKFQPGPSLSAVLTLICFFLVFIVLVGLFVPMFIEQAYNIAGVDFESIARTMQEPIAHLQEWLKGHGILIDSATAEKWLRDAFSSNFDPTRIGGIVSSFFAAASGLFVDISCIVFITFFFLKEQGLFVGILTAVAPAEYEQRIHEAIDDISRLLTRYFGGILLQMLIITTYVSILLTILGVKNALLIGFFAAMMNVIPYVGPLLGGALGIIITITSNVDLNFYKQLLPLLAKVALVFSTVQMLDNYILTPKIFSTSVLAHPLEIFVIILMGAQINGVTGMILAIPAYTVIRVVAKEFLYQYRVVQKLTGKMEEEGY